VETGRLRKCEGHLKKFYVDLGNGKDVYTKFLCIHQSTLAKLYLRKFVGNQKVAFLLY